MSQRAFSRRAGLDKRGAASEHRGRADQGGGRPGMMLSRSADSIALARHSR